jgi:aspartyl-tRNA(Asn)/glutamyl-tRNA(Gln) amidotransferase subunit B
MSWHTIIGLEVHAQLKTTSKLFSGSATHFGAPPNSQTSFIDAGFPGVLPVLNQTAVSMAIQFGLAIEAEINDLSIFERKNYFYPDLPKGYQISQSQRPIIGKGAIDVRLDDGQIKRVSIERAHLEEDAGKSLHDAQPNYTGIDLNRAGTPLLEIVTTPCLYSAHEAVAYLKTLHQLLRFLDICDGNMQEGSFRCDVNISLRASPDAPLGTRTELKNLNSFRFIEKAIEYEQQRQQDCLETGQILKQETRLYCPNTNRTIAMRSKENENDYRYFPDPDLLPIHISASFLDNLRENMPELPNAIQQRLQHEALSVDDIDFLLSSPSLLHYYDALRLKTHAKAKTVSNWLKGTYSAALNEKGLSFENPPVSVDELACLLNRLEDQVIPASLAKTIFSSLMEKEGSVDDLIAASGYQPADTSALEAMIQTIIAQYPEQVLEFRSGKEKLLSFFIGQVMKQTKGQGDPAIVNQLLMKQLSMNMD